MSEHDLSPLGRGWWVVVTAEHGGNRVPEPFAPLFREAGSLLRSHRGWDPGTLVLARALARRLGTEPVTSEVTRLLVDLNRSPHNPRVFSEITRRLPRAERRALLDTYHRPHWDRVRAAIAAGLGAGARVLHLAVHSFVPVLDGSERRTDLALLYDPGRAAERALCARWTSALAVALTDRSIRRNHPYRGNADGLTTALRREHPDPSYLGIEVEVSQRHVGPSGRFPGWVAEGLLRTLEPACAVLP